MSQGVKTTPPLLAPWRPSPLQGAHLVHMHQMAACILGNAEDARRHRRHWRGSLRRRPRAARQCLSRSPSAPRGKSIAWREAQRGQAATSARRRPVEHERRLRGALQGPARRTPWRTAARRVGRVWPRPAGRCRGVIASLHEGAPPDLGPYAPPGPWGPGRGGVVLTPSDTLVGPNGPLGPFFARSPEISRG